MVIKGEKGGTDFIFLIKLTKGKYKMKETTSPTCNYCGYEFDEDETWYSSSTNNPVHTGDGDDSALICPSCSKSIFIVCVHNVAFKAVDEYGEDL